MKTFRGSPTTMSNFVRPRPFSYWNLRRLMTLPYEKHLDFNNALSMVTNILNIVQPYKSNLFNSAFYFQGAKRIPIGSSCFILFSLIVSWYLLSKQASKQPNKQTPLNYFHDLDTIKLWSCFWIVHISTSLVERILLFNIYRRKRDEGEGGEWWWLPNVAEL